MPTQPLHAPKPRETPCRSREKGTFAIVSWVYAQNCSLWHRGLGGAFMGTAKQLRDLQILNLILRGMKLGRIAHHLGLHRNTIAKTLRKPETRQLLEAMQQELVEQTSRD